MKFKRAMVPLAFGACAVGLMVVSQLASAVHVRPKGASPDRVALVPAYKQCTTANTTHAAPLAFGSCNPPVQASSFLTVGTADANGAGANFVGFILLKVKGTSPEDVIIQAGITDVRCQPAASAAVCNSLNASDGPDYAGQLQADIQIRITDHNNGPSQPVQTATVEDISFRVNGQCSNTTATNIGGTCTINTTFNTVTPGAITDLQRMVVEIRQLQVFDGGADGDVETDDNTVFLIHGIFVP
jgi:hypothetical protein